jgi:predicted exporter
MSVKTIRLPLLFITVMVTALLLANALTRLIIDTDVAAGLPADDNILADAVYLFKNHPIQNEIAIDVGLDPKDPPNRDLLVKIADRFEQYLSDSGLFDRVGRNDLQKAIPQLIGHIVDHLPYLFSEQELADQIAPLLLQESVEKKIRSLQQSLIGFDGIGQAGLMAHDPLGFRDLKLSELAALAPAADVQIYKGKLLSADGRHVMISAQPSGSGTDTAFARKLTAVLDGAGTAIKTIGKERVTITPVGAYRAALDNESMVRRDVNKAILLATAGIALLLVLAFPRPLVGLLALLPAVAGTTASLWVYSLFNESISIVALGFGGGVISITVDHGIAYLLFLDRPEKTSGKYASREIWAVGLLAVLTTIGAFTVLSFSGFLIFKQLGIFTAMGIGFSFLFVHTVFPRLFPSMPPARTTRRKPLQSWADAMAGLGVKGGLTALAAGTVLIFWAEPHFNVDLARMNSVSENTRAAEAHFTDVWGNVFSKIYLMTEAAHLKELQDTADRLLADIETAQRNGEITTAFSLSRIFPGTVRRQANLEAWQRFWTPRKIAELQQIMVQAALKYGFNENAFKPFGTMLASPCPNPPMLIEARFHSLLGILRSDNNAKWRLISGVSKGPRYNGRLIYDRFATQAKVFDADLFSHRMGQLLFTTFGKMLLIIGTSAVALLLVFFADWKLTLISLLPMAFAFACTLGSLGLMGRSLDIPALMLAIIVLGLGIDYSLFFVRSYQRYQTADHPNASLIRMAVLMASMSTLIGFGVLCGSEHSLLRSAGLTSLMGIGFSMIGAFLILPPALKRYFRPPSRNPAGPLDGDAAVLARYAKLEPYPRFFARFKLKTDPLFKELRSLLPPRQESVRTIVDIGTGYGVPACWLLEHYPDARILGIEPDPARVRVANFALGNNGTVEQGLAPHVPEPAHPADAAFMLDMCHFLNDDDFQSTVGRVNQTLRQDGLLVIRAVLPLHGPPTWAWRLDRWRMRLLGIAAHHRPGAKVIEMLQGHGFHIQQTEPSGNHNNMAWIVARKRGR